MKTFLSFDGGGIRGRLSLRVAAAVESMAGMGCAQLAQSGGLLGCSTGGIIALALAKRNPLTAVQVDAFFASQGPKIFSRSWLWKLRSKGGLSQHKYQPDALCSALSSVFGEQTMGDLTCRVLIPAYDVIHERAFWFDSATGDRSLRLVDVALATSAAPTYFPPRPIGMCAYVDGGLFANMPASAVANDNARILAIGTGNVAPAYKLADVENWSLLEWAVPALQMLQEGAMERSEQECATNCVAGNYLRINTATLVNSAMDDASETNLAALAIAGDALVEANRSALAAWVATAKAEVKR